MATVTGADGDDLLVGSLYESNIIEGLGGDDTLIGGELNDTLDGGAGEDVFRIHLGHTDEGRTSIEGGSGVDTLVTSGSLSIADISGVEILEVRDGGVFGLVEDLESFEIIRLASGYVNDYVSISSKGSHDLSDELMDTSVYYTTYEDGGQFVSGSGDDTLEGQFGVNLFDGRAGRDVLIGEGTLLGGAGDDSLTGVGTLDGGDGDDTIESGGDQVTVNGGAGDDQISIRSGENATVAGGSGDDLIHFEYYSFFRELDGGDGYDTLRKGQDFSDAVIRNVERLETLDTATLTVAQLAGFEAIASADPKTAANIQLAGAGTIDLSAKLEARSANIVGSAGDDVVTTGAGDDVLHGGEGTGRDVLNAGAGDDRLITGLGRDQLYGDEGDDVFEGVDTAKGLLDGGDGHDTLEAAGDYPSIDFSKATLIDIEVLDTRAGYARGTADQFESFEQIISSSDDRFNGIELSLSEAGDLDLSRQAKGQDVVVNGSGGDDVIRLSNGGDSIWGKRGDDRLYGGKGDDGLLGEDGDDVLVGGGGDDDLFGGKGENVFRGGGGEDRFKLSGSFRDDVFDVIADFETGVDRMYLIFPNVQGNEGRIHQREFKDLADGDLDNDDRYVYDSKSGFLYLREGEKLSTIAKLTDAPDLNWQDIIIG